MAAYRNEKLITGIHSVRELFGITIGSDNLSYLASRVSLDVRLTREQENLLLRHKAKLLNGELSMDCQYYLARKLEDTGESHKSLNEDWKQ